MIRGALEKAGREGKGTYAGADGGNAAASGDKASVGSEIKQAVLTGVSYIIPIIVAGGMINAFAVLIAQALGFRSFTTWTTAGCGSSGRWAETPWEP